MNARPDSGRGHIGYWITTWIAAAGFAIAGCGNLIHAPHFARDMSHLGYPAYFMTILGAWKVLAAVAVLAPGFPRLKEWAYAGMIFDLTGAAFSRFAMQDGAAMIAIPLLIGSIVIVSWALRPAGRRLPHVKSIT
jgi:uncharacterized membrane protein YphA (DoxX/SURF4 family)